MCLFNDQEECIPSPLYVGWWPFFGPGSDSTLFLARFPPRHCRVRAKLAANTLRGTLTSLSECSADKFGRYWPVGLYEVCHLVTTTPFPRRFLQACFCVVARFDVTDRLRVLPQISPVQQPTPYPQTTAVQSLHTPGKVIQQNSRYQTALLSHPSRSETATEMRYSYRSLGHLQ